MSTDVTQRTTKSVAAKTNDLAVQSPRRQLLRRFGRSRSAQIGLGLTAIIVVVSLFAPLLSDQEPNAMSPMAILQGPTRDHLFGTDDFGRDVFTRVLYGGRISIFVGFTVALITGVLGVLIGAVTGYYQRVDGPIMRIMDALMAFPAILLAIGIMAILGPRLINIIAALVIVYTPRCARVARGSVIAIRDQDFVLAARAIGISGRRIMLRHLIPNSMAPVLVQQTFILAVAVLAESSLNFLGVGVPPDVPTLGSILSDSRTFLRDAPWMSIYPGIFISVLVLGFNLLGDGLRDVLDPRMRL
ncbi:MAG: ABC transporter permease [Thermomicrobiales bacterium]|nr:ABC transporter permease [Thermomicrobiales bacterium]